MNSKGKYWFGMSLKDAQSKMSTLHPVGEFDVDFDDRQISSGERKKIPVYVVEVPDEGVSLLFNCDKELIIIEPLQESNLREESDRTPDVKPKGETDHSS